ncbi:SDR family NAD(P)-dependent oxidoreductase [Alicyclobacillus dauci]|uniref:SDR family oxidoreductase n=1 Tax=Alicyclobacillus dauci TaxID=1475485 RepID=A0ABY6YZA3_9BACL|nr:SDR family NAD(P)-dependent oxidoreductase [Alicyclobacillus dauci]WAH35598.1 SDR family oxidoreductase [Alicyclobacillus dauci]
MDVTVSMTLLRDKVCVITGGAGSIGLETCRLFLEQGAKVMLIDLYEKLPENIVKDLDMTRVMYRKANVSCGEEIRDCFSDVVSRFGKVDVIFSNAGNSGAVAPVHDLPEQEFDAIYAVHVKGAFLTCKYGIPVMNNGGSIIITSSVAAFRGDAGIAAYITAKHAQIGLMRTIAKEVAARNIRVNTIHPGPVSNEFQATIEDNLTKIIGTNATHFFNNLIPLARHASPREIANSVLYLASDLSSFTTGTTLVVDGGMSS